MTCDPKVIKLKTILAFTGCLQHCCCFFQMIPLWFPISPVMTFCSWMSAVSSQSSNSVSDSSEFHVENRYWRDEFMTLQFSAVFLKVVYQVGNAIRSMLIILFRIHGVMHHESVFLCEPMVLWYIQQKQMHTMEQRSVWPHRHNS